MIYSKELAIFWLIKKHAPITVSQIIDRILQSNKIDHPTSLLKLRLELPGNILNIRIKVGEILDTLINYQMIEIIQQSENCRCNTLLRHADHDPKLKPTRASDSIMKFFAIDLDKYVNNKGNLYLVSPLFKEVSLKKRAVDLFFITSKESEEIYSRYVLPIGDSLDLQCRVLHNVDILDEYAIQNVWTTVLNCQILVTDITDNNPNILYILGIAHTVGCQVILTSQSPNSLLNYFPHKQYIIYDVSTSGLKQFYFELQERFMQLLSKNRDHLL